MIGVGYTVPALVSVVAVVLLELCWLRTGLFRRAGYWITMVIVLGFQIPVDGYLTKLDSPIVVYDPRHILGVRVPWDIPIEDFLFGFSLITVVLLLWLRQRRAQEAGSEEGTRDEPG